MSASKPISDKKTASPEEGSYLGQQKRQYLIASRIGAWNLNLMSVGAQSAANQLKALGVEFEPVKTLRGRSAAVPLSTLGAGLANPFEILVARLHPDQGEALRAQSAAGLSPLIVEYDAPLTYGTATSIKQGLLAASFGWRMDRSKLQPAPVRIQVVGEEDRPLTGVTITLYGVGQPAEAVTDDKGLVELSLYSLQAGQAQALLVKPRKDYWDLVMRNVELRLDGPNVIRLRSFSETVPRYDTRPYLSWGQEAMMQNQYNGSLDGEGVKVAIIDSGCDNTHPLLQHITQGTDILDGGQSLGWTLDQMGHGTHCAGIIGARSTRGYAMRGFAPAAEIHVFKIFPGGRFSDLINALDQCIDEGIDLVNLSLGTEEISVLVEQKLQEARLRGLACFVAAGNSGGPVQYPAKSPTVLAVAALGRQMIFPSDSSHALAVTELQCPDGTFSPAFTCHGPEVGVCAPGVAVISTVPGSGFDAMDGTSMATAHVTGLATILLAHHPLFKSGLGKERSANRVEALFQLIKQNAALLPFGTDRTGAGLPTLAVFNIPLAAERFAGMQMPLLSQRPLGQPGFVLIPPQNLPPVIYQGAAAIY